MGQLNLLLTCIVIVMMGYLGTHSAYVEPSGLPWSLVYELYDGVSDASRFDSVGVWARRPEKRKVGGSIPPLTTNSYSMSWRN